jgi:hypothetical protein
VIGNCRTDIALTRDSLKWGFVVREKTLLGNFFCFRMAGVIAVKKYMLDMCEFSFDGMVFE